MVDASTTVIIPFNAMCRTCLCNCTDKVSFKVDSYMIFEDAVEDLLLVADILTCYTAITIGNDDALPKQVCQQCLVDLTKCHNFIKKCQRSQQTLLDILNQINTKKVETLSNNDKVTADELDQSNSYIRTENNPQQTFDITKAETCSEINEKSVNELHADSYKAKSEQTLKRTSHKCTTVKAERRTIKRKVFYYDKVKENDTAQKKSIKTLFIAAKQRLAALKQMKKELNKSSVRKQKLHCNQISIEKDEMLSNITDNPKEIQQPLREVTNRKSTTTTRRKQQPSLRKSRLHCYLCDITFSARAEYSDHLKEFKHPLPRKFPCSLCDKRFPSRASLAGHVRSHTKEKPFLCEHCPATFSNINNLRRHQMIHSGERPHVCNVCGKGFIQKVQLVAHLPKHTGVSPYICETCGNGFKQLGLLKKHVCGRRTRVSQRRIEGPLKCNVCNKIFRYPLGLRIHGYIHTGERPYKCKVCEKGFRQSQHLKTHVKVQHLHMKPYECGFCGKRFGEKAPLIVHERRHTGERPFVCQVCGRGFSDARGKRKHLKTHLQEQTAKSESQDSL